MSLPRDTGWVAIVDDDESIRRSLRRVFLTNGISARTFGSAEDYLNRPEADEPCCMVLDVQLCGLSGFELQDRLSDAGRAPPIIFITALGEIPSSQLEKRSATTGYLRKPFDPNTLFDLVQPYVVAAG